MTMTKRVCTIAGAAVAALAGGCKNFLTPTDAIQNPNLSATASTTQRLTAVEINFEALQTGDPARTVALWMNQFAGTDRQYGSTARYIVDETFSNGVFSTIYAGGGIIDLRAVEQTSDAAGDSVTAGIARVMEAWEIGTAADLFGDVPYTTAFDPTKPATLDPQASVYAAAQTLLSRGIKQLQSKTGAGPGIADLFYSGDPTKWTQAAYTLKARFYLHTAERKGTAADGTPAFDVTAYQNALAAAQNGIASPANDLRSYQSSAQTESNLLYQFAFQQRSGYVAPHVFFVNLLTARNDPRLTLYFTPASGQTKVIGAPSGGSGGPAANVASFNNSTGIGAPTYRWPMISYAENQLILAEANYRLGNTDAALTAYNAERKAAGFAAPVTALPAGAAGLQEIMTEKYDALVQNLEVYNDFRRTCYPVLTPNGSSSNQIPSRFYYPQGERQSNPNIPSVSAQQSNFRNPNDPNPCFNGTRQTTT